MASLARNGLKNYHLRQRNPKKPLEYLKISNGAGLC